jgi:hypothetical protein
VSAGEFLLRWLRFVDGSDQSFCHGPHDRVAFTSPGRYVIYICGANPHAVATFSATSPNAEAVVIHEMLHALGLGENPPTRVKSPDGCCLDAMDVAERRGPYQGGSAAVEGTT